MVFNLRCPPQHVAEVPGAQLHHPALPERRDHCGLSSVTSKRSSIQGGHEIVLVNDGSTDRTREVASRARLEHARIPITLVEHARNFGEHNAVLTGWRHASGAHFVNLDDDGQNPPGEAVRLWRHATETGLDVVFGHYTAKQHRPSATWAAGSPTG